MLSRPPGANWDRVPIYTPWNLWIWIWMRFRQWQRGCRVCLDHFHSPPIPTASGAFSCTLDQSSCSCPWHKVYLTRTALVRANELYSVAVVLVENIGVFQSRMSHLSTTLGKGLSILFNTTLYCIHNHNYSLLFPDQIDFTQLGVTRDWYCWNDSSKGRCARPSSIRKRSIENRDLHPCPCELWLHCIHSVLNCTFYRLLSHLESQP